MGTGALYVGAKRMEREADHLRPIVKAKNVCS